MERLQAAIQKAREQRETRGQVPDRAASASSSASTRTRHSSPEVDLSVDERWQALQELTLDRRRLQRSRIVSLRAGGTSAPFDVMRTRLMQQARANNWRRIAIVSPHHASGKTTTTANLAFSLSRHRDLRTIVMDFDLRRGGLSKLLLDKNNALGPMGDVLEGRAPFAQNTFRYGAGLAFGLGHGVAVNAAEMLQSGQTLDLLQEVEAQYAPDFMIFDLPPLNIGDDNLGFLTQVDAALILTEAEKTTLSQIDVAERQVAELTNVMGIVLNKSRYVSGTYTHDEYY